MYMLFARLFATGKIVEKLLLLLHEDILKRMRLGRSNENSMKGREVNKKWTNFYNRL